MVDSRQSTVREPIPSVSFVEFIVRMTRAVVSVAALLNLVSFGDAHGFSPLKAAGTVGKAKSPYGSDMQAQLPGLQPQQPQLGGLMGMPSPPNPE